MKLSTPAEMTRLPSEVTAEDIRYFEQRLVATTDQLGRQRLQKQIEVLKQVEAIERS